MLSDDVMDAKKLEDACDTLSGDYLESLFDPNATDYKQPRIVDYLNNFLAVDNVGDKVCVLFRLRTSQDWHERARGDVRFLMNGYKFGYEIVNKKGDLKVRHVDPYGIWQMSRQSRLM
jgi:hypothetical protein